MRYLDLHSDTITMLHYPKENLADNKRMVSISKMQEGGAWIQCFSAFVPTGYFPHLCRDAFTWKRFCDIADKKDRLLELHEDALTMVTSGTDIERLMQNPENGKIGVIFTGEDLGVIGSDLRKLDTVYQRGVRIATLTWNHENMLGFPNSVKPQVMQEGLKPFGIEAVERMNELGMVIDVSHLSDGGFRDVARISKKPFIASHSNSREITDHPRNLTDAMIKAIAESGGVIGLNFAPHFLSERGESSRIRDMLQHIRHIRNVGGSDVLALGTDFDGISGRLEIDSPAKMPRLSQVLTKCGMKEAEQEKMFYGNAVRVFREVWKP